MSFCFNSWPSWARFAIVKLDHWETIKMAHLIRIDHSSLAINQSWSQSIRVAMCHGLEWDLLMIIKVDRSKATWALWSIFGHKLVLPSINDDTSLYFAILQACFSSSRPFNPQNPLLVLQEVSILVYGEIRFTKVHKIYAKNSPKVQLESEKTAT